MTGAVSIQDLSFSYEKDPVISHLDLTLSAGTVTAVLGANGVGKTTLLHLLLGLFEPDTGEIRFFGRPAHNMCF
jgi:ABC-type Mn2+/Zn2+ transport system ATPase subunit